MGDVEVYCAPFLRGGYYDQRILYGSTPIFIGTYGSLLLDSSISRAVTLVVVVWTMVDEEVQDMKRRDECCSITIDPSP